LTRDYHLVYKPEDFSETLLEGVKRLTTQQMGKQDIQNLANFFRTHFNIKPRVKIKIYKREFSPLNEAIYLDCDKEIIFYCKPQLITILHELRHYIQFNTDFRDLEFDYDDKEEEARAWSASLYYILYPNQYMNLYDNNLLKYK
jgi:hypothetical protein